MRQGIGTGTGAATDRKGARLVDVAEGGLHVWHRDGSGAVPVDEAVSYGQPREREREIDVSDVWG